MHEPTVSAVIPVFNGSRYLEECIRSVLSQGKHLLEVIVVDDGSTDDSTAVVRRFPTVRLIEQRHAGVAVARNTGITAARGSLIAFTDQDDRWTPGKLDVQVNFMLERTDLDFTLTYVRVFLESGAKRPLWNHPGVLEEALPGHLTGTMLARRDVFDRIGMFDPGCADGCDTDWFLRARDHQLAFEMLPDVLLEKRAHADNTSLRIDHCQRTLLQAVRRSVRRRRSATEPRS